MYGRSSPGATLRTLTLVPRRVFTDLDLHGSTPARAQPKIGDWGPAAVPTTRSKKWMRLWVSLAFVVAAAALFGLGYYVFTAING